MIYTQAEGYFFCDARMQKRAGQRGMKVRRLAALAAITLLWSGTAYAAEGRILLLRGWFGVFSTGLDELVEQLKTKGLHAQAVGHAAWKAQVGQIIKDRAAGKTGLIVLVGHSQGANNAIEMARLLTEKNIQVDLLVTLAPFMQDPIPTNVLRAINYYQSPGWGAPLHADPGFRGKLSNVDVGSDLSISHITIDKSSTVQADMVREITAVFRSSR